MELNCESILFRLPKYVFLSFCSDWISTIDFCKLDSSMTNRNFRLTHDMYATSGMLILSDGGVGVTLTKKCFNWLIKRNFLIKTLTVPSNVLLPTKELQNKTTKDIFKRLKSICFIYNRKLLKQNFDEDILLSGCQETLIESCVLLENLDISKSENMLSAKFYDTVAKHCPLLKVFTAGNGLDCYDRSSWDSYDHGISGVTVSVALKALAKGCKLLEVFTTESSHPLDNAHVTLAASCKHLKVLRFGNSSPQIKYDSMLTSLANNCPDLREFFIFGQFTEPVLRKFAMSCKQLTKLAICTYDLLTDAILVAIGCYCEHLTHLDIRNCYVHTVTIGGVHQLLTNCPTLTYLSLPRLPYDEVLSLFSTTQFCNLVEVQMDIFDYSHGVKQYNAVQERIKEFESVVKTANIATKFGYRRRIW